MENKVEQLLNSLIEKGWKPSGKECSHFIMQNDAKVLDWKVIYTAVRKDEGVYNIHYTLRELISKESGLWQFVCENNLNYSEDDSIYNVWLKHYAEDDHESPYTYASPVWYLIESSLKDDSELEDFLLSNIIIKDE